MIRSATYRSFAKINLYLDVIRRRRDGYNDIETIFQTVSLADELHFETQPSGISMECSHPDVPCDESNLAYRAALLLQGITGCAEGVHVRIEKRIPVAAGLAGGSGNAAATLVVLNDLWNLGLSFADLTALALQLGSDVPYCLTGGTVAATGRGERMAPLEELPDTWIVLLHPGLHISTAAVYGSPRLIRGAELPFNGRTASFRRAIAALRRGDFPNAVFNRMETPVFDRYPELAEAKRRLLDAGCLAAAMSGSGPTLFGVCGSRAAAEHIADRLSPDMPGDYAHSIVCTVRMGGARVAG